MRGVRWPRLASRRLGQSAPRRWLLSVRYRYPDDGSHELAEADRLWSLGNEPGDWDRSAHREINVGRTRNLCRLPRAAQGDHKKTSAWRDRSRRLFAGAAAIRSLSRRWAARR